MKAKTLLIAAATLAAGVMSSQAAVYSQNVVGYVNVVITNQGSYNLICNPLDDGAGNYLTNVLSLATAPLIKGSQCLTWNQAGASYITVPVGGSTTAGTNWPAGTTTQIPPGVGFFIRNGAKSGDASVVFTNTFVGTVALASGQSVTNAIPNGYQMYGSTLPISGNVCVGGTPGGDPNFNYTPLIKGSQVLTWNLGNQSFITTPLGGNSTAGTNWASTINVGVGQGFFIFNKGAATNMIQAATF
jgi:hypothetical protein